MNGIGMEKEVNENIIFDERYIKKYSPQTIAEIIKNLKAEGIKVSREAMRKILKSLDMSQNYLLEAIL